MQPVGPEILGHLLDRHGPALVLYARQWCATPEDVVQEAFVKLAGQQEWPQTVVPWLYRVVRNGAISAARREQRRRRHELAAATQETWFVNVDDALDGETVAEILKALPLEFREAIVARLWGELTYDEIGCLMGTSSSTAHRHYETGLSLLRERLGVGWAQETKPATMT